MEKKITNVQDGQTFEIAGIEFIKFPATAEGVPVVARDLQKAMTFGDNNDLRESKVLRWLREEFLPKIVADVGEENLVQFQTDLTTLDGLDNYGVMESKISLPTLEFYRQNAEIFDKHPVKEWWWLATPESCQPHDDPYWLLCVAPSGYFNYNVYCYSGFGVRPFLIFKSTIFESLES
jgi:hypothetical protein